MRRGAIRSSRAFSGYAAWNRKMTNAYRRYIYIHGTPEERNIGLPVSYGCVRMRSRDVIQLYATSGSAPKSRSSIRTSIRSIRRFFLLAESRKR